MRQLKRLFQISPGDLTKRLLNVFVFWAGSAREARRDAGRAVPAAAVPLPCACAAVRAMVCVAGLLPVGLLGVAILKNKRLDVAARDVQRDEKPLFSYP